VKEPIDIQVMNGIEFFFSHLEEDLH